MMACQLFVINLLSQKKKIKFAKEERMKNLIQKKIKDLYEKSEKSSSEKRIKGHATLFTPRVKEESNYFWAQRESIEISQSR